MDSGLVTSEGSATERMMAMDLHAAPSITCRTCRVQVSIDAIEAHECLPDDLVAVAARKSMGAETPVLAMAAKVGGVFVDTLLSAEQDNFRLPERAESPTSLREQRQHQFEWSQSSKSTSSSTQSSPTHSRSVSLTQALCTGRPASAYATGESEAPVLHSTLLDPLRQRSLSSAEPLIQCRVKGVRVRKDGVALYSITSNVVKRDLSVSLISSSLISALGFPPTSTIQEIVVERRYREFYAFALTVYAMFPSKELWARLPPKTRCCFKNTYHDGFLLRRKDGLDDFIRCAIERMSLVSISQGTIGQWYLVRKFLNLPATLLSTPTKDRSIEVAMEEMKANAHQTTNWTPVGWCEGHDAIYEKGSDVFLMIKRVRQCRFPARAVYDMIVGNHGKASGGTRTGGSGDSILSLLDAKVPSSASSSGASPVVWNPLVESTEILWREDGHTWVESTVFKGGWFGRKMQMTSIKSWKVEDTGTILIAMIPAEDQGGPDISPECHRVDCVMGGWVITPTPNDETCTVTWIMEANFGECDPSNEFTGCQGHNAYNPRKILLSWADEITFLLAALERSYVPAYYRALGPLLSGGDLQRVKLELSDASSMRAIEDPRVYTLAHELEPTLCLLIHKNTNKNALIFKTNLRSKSDLDPATPVKAEWLMFEKNGNPRQDLSPIERSTTYHFATKEVGPNVHRFRLELIRRDCVLRYDPRHGFALFTTINGKPNTLLKRVFINYAKSSLLSFPRIEDVTLISDTDLETVNDQVPK